MRGEQGRVIVKVKKRERKENKRKKKLGGKKPKSKRTEADAVVGKNSAKNGIIQCFIICYLPSKKTVEKE